MPSNMLIPVGARLVTFLAGMVPADQWMVFLCPRNLVNERFSGSLCSCRRHFYTHEFLEIDVEIILTIWIVRLLGVREPGVHFRISPIRVAVQVLRNSDLVSAEAIVSAVSEEITIHGSGEVVRVPLSWIDDYGKCLIKQ